MATSKSLTVWIKNVTPNKAESVLDVSAVDYAQIMVHFKPSLGAQLCFDDDAPASSHKKSLQVIVDEIIAQQPAFKTMRVTPDAVVRKDPKACQALCEALHKLAEKQPFPKTYNPKAERSRLGKRVAQKRPLEEANANVSGTKDNKPSTNEFAVCDRCKAVYDKSSAVRASWEDNLVSLRNQFLELILSGIEPSVACDVMMNNINRAPPTQLLSPRT